MQQEGGRDDYDADMMRICVAHLLLTCMQLNLAGRMKIIGGVLQARNWAATAAYLKVQLSHA
jgi:hypothetical protein